MRECSACHGQTPDGEFCVRCGAPLAESDTGSLTRSRQRRQFAAAPSERRYAPWLVSTLFPHLPRHSERHFYAAVTGSAVLLAVLGAVRLFPVALITAAAVMPLLTLVYFHDVDIYEGEPAWALTWTIAWGAVCGVGVGLLAKAVVPTGLAMIDKSSTAHLVTGGILLPLLGTILAVGGPLVLLRYRLFNDALDGVAFGAASAAALAGAQAIVVGADVLAGGLRPPGAAAPWIERLLGLGIATPVLAMAAVAAAEAAVWLRYRAPVADRAALGAFGQPPVAIALAIALVVAGAVGETFMAAGVWLAWLVALDLVAVVLLRRALHIGLLEEAAERDPGPEIVCANCGANTISHTFCGTCGVALNALPKRARTPGRGRLPAAIGAAVVLAVGVGLLVGALGSRSAPRPSCAPGSICGSPPIFAHAVFAFPGDTPWQSSGLGVTLRFGDAQWSLARSDADDVQLNAADGSVLQVNTLPATQATPLQALRDKASALSGELLGFTRDTNRSDQLLGTEVGEVPGPGAVYVGTVATPQGPQQPVNIAIISAEGDGVTIVATLITADSLGAGSSIAGGADDIIDSIGLPAT